MSYSPLFMDLSNNDPVFNAEEYRKAGHVIVALKATEGTSFVDQDHAGLAHHAGEHGVAVMHYHFARPDTGNDPHSEAAHFLATAERGNLDGPHDYLILDLERATPQGWRHDPSWSRHFDQFVRANSRFRTILYSFRSALQTAPASQWFAAPPFREWDADFSSGLDGGSKGAIIVARQFTDGVIGPGPHQLPGGPVRSDVDILRGAFRTEVFRAAAA